MPTEVVWYVRHILSPQQITELLAEGSMTRFLNGKAGAGFTLRTLAVPQQYQLSQQLLPQVFQAFSLEHHDL